VKSRQRTFGMTHKLKLNSQIREMSLRSECQAVLLILQCNHPPEFNRIYPGFSFLGDWRRIQRACIATSGFVICGFPYPKLQCSILSKPLCMTDVWKRQSVIELSLSTFDRLSSDYILITNLMHWLLFIHKILFSCTCFEPQVLIFRRI